MNGISSIVATALLLSMTIVAGILLYNYVLSQMNTTNRGELLVLDAYYSKPFKKIVVIIENTGLSEVNITGIEILDSNNTTQSITPTLSTIPPGRSTIEMNWNQTSTPRYLVVRYGYESTQPIAIRIVS